MYSSSCDAADGAAPATGESMGNTVYTDPDGNRHAYSQAPVQDSSTNDPTFGTAENPDTCQYDIGVSHIYTNVCPQGGSPVPKYGPCGGQDYDGPKCCFGYSTCVKVCPHPLCLCRDCTVAAWLLAPGALHGTGAAESRWGICQVNMSRLSSSACHGCHTLPAAPLVPL